MEVVVRVLMVLGGVITGWFVSKDAHNFHVLNFMVTLGLLTLVVALMAYRKPLWVRLKYLWRHRIKTHS